MRRVPPQYSNGNGRLIEPPVRESPLLHKSCGSNVLDLANSSIEGRRVLVTGAGGSIGSELVKQLSTLSPAHVTLIDSCEFNLYQIDRAIERAKAGFSWTARIGDVQDLCGMRQAFMHERPDIVFHAAALKHVPLLEASNVVEAVRTNVLGTKTVLDLCVAAGITFLLISTDKAVNPSSQMGLTKRVAEILVHEKALRHPETRLSLVRFGNVLGSSGSVVPLFRNQIDSGGPVTVTHPEMTRYLMSIEEAVRLTLAASSLPQSGCSVYVLEMGGQVRIVDLAVEMIQMSGRRPFVDIDVQFVGMRPGEKLHEELSYPWEQLQPTEVTGVRVAIPSFDPRPSLRHIHELLAAADARDSEWVKRALVQIVPEYVGWEKQPHEMLGVPRSVGPRLQSKLQDKLQDKLPDKLLDKPGQAGRNGHALSATLRGKIMAISSTGQSRLPSISDQPNNSLRGAGITRTETKAIMTRMSPSQSKV